MPALPNIGGAEALALFSAIAAAFGTLSGFAFSLISQSARSRLSRAQFFIDFTDRYNRPEMHKALVNLQVLKGKYGEGLFPLFADEFARRSELGAAIDADRRIVNRYFANIAEMHMNGLINASTAKMLLNYRGLNVFYDIVVPLNRAKYGKEPHYEIVLNTLKTLRKRYDYAANAPKLSVNAYDNQSKNST